MLLGAINARFSEHERKIGRQLMEVEHRHDAKLMSMTEDIIDIRSKYSNQPRLAKAEDEIKELRRELQVSDIATCILCCSSFCAYLAPY